jgi:uncharacterized protein YndB with AHSA1/START domain
MSNSAATSQTVMIERTFPYPPEKLWRALTESQLLARWLLNNDFAPEAGRKFQFRAEPVLPHWDGVIDCEVLVLDPLKSLSYTWRSMGLDSVVLFTLTHAEGGTHLRVEQSGFRPDQRAAYQGATYGWQKFFGGLERVLGEDFA